MPRTIRASQGGYCYHVLNRGNGRARVFHKDADYAAFLKAIREGDERTPIRLVAYCLMPNHFHLVVWPRRDGELSELKGSGVEWHFHQFTRAYPLRRAHPERL